jgi:hypothetical protein
MRAKADGSKANEVQFELKYCERCGGLWLRPVGGEQIYCAACGRAMAELPPAFYERKAARRPRGPASGTSDGEPGGNEERGDVA